MFASTPDQIRTAVPRTVRRLRMFAVEISGISLARSKLVFLRGMAVVKLETQRRSLVSVSISG